MATEKKREFAWGCVWALIGFFVIAFFLIGEKDGYGKAFAVTFGKFIGLIVAICVVGFIGEQIGRAINKGR